MKRVLLVHWNPDEAEDRADRLRRAGVKSDTLATSGPADLPGIQRDPPDAVVIDLDRIPSRGRDFGILLRARKATRLVPIVFVGGAGKKVGQVRELLPDATFTSWSRIRGALRGAIDRAPRKPATPGVMAGYSGTPLPKKLGVKSGVTVALLGAPKTFERTLGPPEGVRLRRQARGTADVVMLFVKSHADLDRRHPAAVRTLAEGGRLWIAWPKKASGVETDLTQTIVRRYGLERELVDYKICAIDTTWSGLCFARRRGA